MARTWESIEAWAEAHGLTLEDALADGVSQDDDGNIHIPDSTWEWLQINGLTEGGAHGHR